MVEDQYEYSDVEFEYWWRQVKDGILSSELELWKSRAKSSYSDEVLIEYIKGIYRKWWTEDPMRKMWWKKMKEEIEESDCWKEKVAEMMFYLS